MIYSKKMYREVVQTINSYIKLAKADNNIVLEGELRDIKVRFASNDAHFAKYAILRLNSTVYDSVKVLILFILPLHKDVEIVTSLIKFLRKKNTSYIKSSTLWCLSYYNCSAYMIYMSKLLFNTNQANESAYALLEIIRNMKGPFDYLILKKSLTTLLKKEFNTSYAYNKALQVIFAQAIECYAIYYAGHASNELEEFDKEYINGHEQNN